MDEQTDEGWTDRWIDEQMWHNQTKKPDNQASKVEEGDWRIKDRLLIPNLILID